MPFYPLMRASEAFWVPEPVEVVRERIEDGRHGGLFPGMVGERTFQVQHAGQMRRNSWRPRISGRLVPREHGTLVEVDLAVHPFVLVFTFFHAIPFMGLSWLMGVAAFSWEAGPAIQALDAVLQATARGEGAYALADRVGDPSVQGSELSAPRRLEVVVTPASATFTLRDPDTAGLSFLPGKVRRLEADAAGVEFRRQRDDPPTRIDWAELGRCDVSPDGDLVLGDERVEAKGSRQEDLLWLAAWLNARRERLRGPEGDPARRAQGLAGVQRLARSVTEGVTPR